MVEDDTMRQAKPILFFVAIVFGFVIMIPSLLVIPFINNVEEQALKEKKVQEVEKTLAEASAFEVAVYRSKQEIIQEIPLENYIRGVVAAEMPAEFELEALKAQALTARTYIVKHLLNDPNLDLPEGAQVTDTVMHQVYKSPKELKEIWGPDYAWKMARITDAVNQTRGKIITYNGSPITASFFSTSNGYTENSEDYWQNPFPYLRSVESPWDKDSPKFFDQKVVTVTQFENKLGVQLPSEGSVGTILAKTEGNRVAKVEVGGKEFSGREIREKLSLRSTDFTWRKKGNHIIIQTKGYGHGVGMSQYGANGMASQGKTFKDIITHYYQGTSIADMNGYIHTLTAKK